MGFIDHNLKDKPVTIEQEIPAELPGIWTDNTRLRQILLNLISNAAKFTETGTILLQASYDSNWVTLSVADTGPGIPQDKLAEIFEEFTQVDGSTTRKVGGTGLGLPITKKLVEMHGGRIWVESKLDQGSIFTVKLPLKQPAELSNEPVVTEVGAG